MIPINNHALVLGIGNYLMGDEGIGVHLAQEWGKSVTPVKGMPNPDVLDGGTGGFHLLEYFERYDTVILVDATLDDFPPGTVRLIRPRFAEDFPQAMSTHDIGLKDMVGALQLLGKMPEIYLFVVSIDSIQQQGIQLSPAVEATIPFLISRISRLLQDIQDGAISMQFNKGPQAGGLISKGQILSAG